MNEEKVESTLQIVGPKNTFPKVALVDPAHTFAAQAELTLVLSSTLSMQPSNGSENISKSPA